MHVRLLIDEVREILADAEWQGQGPGGIEGFAGLSQAGPQELSFLANKRYAKAVGESRAGAILLPRDYSGDPKEGQWFIRVDSPSLALTLLCERVEAELRPRPEPGVHPSAVIAEDAEVAASAYIGPLCVIESGARVGAHAVLVSQVHLGPGAVVEEQSWLHPQVSVQRHCRVGARCILHSGAVIGADGFGFEPGAEGHRKIPQVGFVELGDDVEVGANSTIDRGRLGPTRIGSGTKIDNLVQIGHNVEVGRHCFLCAQVGISGSTRLGDFVVLAGQAGLAGHLQLADKVQVGAQAGVAKDLPAGVFVTGTPATEFQKQRRLEALVRRLPDLAARIRELEKGAAGA